MNFKLLFVLFISILLVNCAPPKMQVKTITKTIRDTVVLKETKEIRGRYLSAELRNSKVSDEHFPAIGYDERVKHLIVHYTALVDSSSLNVLTKQEVSSHYLIPGLPQEDKIFLLVSEDKRAWHAGKSWWNGRNNLNDSSIGIEIVNQGYTSDGTNKFYFPYQEFQIKKFAELANDIIKRYQIEPTNVLGHSDVAPQRKDDPGPLFPWKRLYQDFQIGAWYEEYDKVQYLSQFPYNELDSIAFILSVQNDFERYGYEIQKTGMWDEQTQKVVTIFQHHFRPNNYSGVLDAETWAILKSLIKKYRTQV